MHDIITLKLSDENELEEWDRYVEGNPSGTPFHLSCWLKTIKDTYHFEDFLLLGKDESGNIAAGLPLFRVPKLLSLKRRLISIPFSDYGGVLSSGDMHGARTISSLLEMQKKTNEIIEIRGGSLTKTHKFKGHNYFKRHILDLNSDLDQIRSKIDKKTILYSIRKAEKSNLTIEVRNDCQAMADFCRLNLLTRKKHGVPCQPIRFFNHLFKNIIEPKIGYIVTASHDTTVIAASIFIKVGDQLHYKYNSSDPAALKQYSPNHLLLWHTIQFAKESGLKSIDFGRTSPDNEGLIRYKNMWGADCTDIPYYFYPEISGTSSIKENSIFYKVLNQIWMKLPNTAIEMMSPLFYRYLT